MTQNDDLIKKALDILVVLNTAVKNVRLYPPTSTTVVSTLEKLHQSFLRILEDADPVIFAESEKILLVFDKPLGSKDQEKPHIRSFLGLLTSFGLKSISFTKGLEKDELSSFLELMSQKPESIKNEGGFGKLLAQRTVSHIVLDQKVYVAIDKNRQLIANLDISDDQITKFLILSRPDLNPNSPQLKELITDPKALSQAFSNGLAQMMGQKGTLTNVQISQNVNHMLWLLDKLSGGLDDKSRSILSHNVGQALITADQTMAKHLTTQNVEHLMGGLLLQYLTDELTPVKGSSAGTGAGQDAAGKEFVPGATQAAAAQTTPQKPAATGESKVMQVAKKYILHIQDDRTLMDASLMSVLSKIVEELVAQKEQETMKMMIERLAENLKNPKSGIRASAARGLADIIEHLHGELVTETVTDIAPHLIAWIKSEDAISDDYQRICDILKNATQEQINQRQYAAALTYLDAFNADANGKNDIPDAAKKIFADMVEQLACSDNMDILLAEINTPESQKREDAGRLMSALGSTAINDLLDQLRATSNSDERVRLMHLIGAAGKKALPILVSRIRKDEPWYFLRNLAYMLGQMGNEDHARVLAPLLQHKNIKLRQEALKSIHRIGGLQKGKLLIPALSKSDDDFKAAIVDALGQAKTVEAVDALLQLLKDRPLVASAARQTLEEKICLALGTIGSPDAIPILSEIAESKTFLGLRSYPEKIKGAAAKTLVILRRKVAESGRDVSSPKP